MAEPIVEPIAERTESRSESLAPGTAFNRGATPVRGESGWVLVGRLTRLGAVDFGTA